MATGQATRSAPLIAAGVQWQFSDHVVLPSADPNFADAHTPEPAVAWPGCYTIVIANTETPPGTVSVWTDVGGSCPIYTTTHGGSTVWGSSSRALASLSGSQINKDWLAAHLAAPLTTPTSDWSAFSGVRLVEGGHWPALRRTHYGRPAN